MARTDSARCCSEDDRSHGDDSHDYFPVVLPNIVDDGVASASRPMLFVVQADNPGRVICFPVPLPPAAHGLPDSLFCFLGRHCFDPDYEKTHQTGRRRHAPRPHHPAVAEPGVGKRDTPTSHGNGPWPPHCRQRSNKITLVRHVCGWMSTVAKSIGFTWRQPGNRRRASGSQLSTPCRSRATNHVSAPRSSSRR
jgi:hypothetical protein